MVRHDALESSDGFTGLNEEGLRGALAEAHTALRDVREAIHSAARAREVESLRAHKGLVDFMHFELQAPLSTIEADCRALRVALPATAPDALRAGLDALQEQVTQLRALLDRTLQRAAESNDSPF